VTAGAAERNIIRPLMMSSSEMTAGSGASVSLSASEWESDPGMGMTGMHLRVLGGGLVWPLAFHKLMAADDCREIVGQ
jgi:hypothetical protein